MKEFAMAVVIAVVVAAVTLSVVEIAGDDDAPAARVESTPGGSPLPTGAGLFVSSGCASCHGSSGEGGVGPALAGHTVEQVIRQARRPLNIMPLYTSDELTDDELERIAAFVVELASEDAGHDPHDEPLQGLDPRDEITMHHWMALSALRAGNADAAAAHMAAIITAVGGEHEAAMNEAAAAVEAADLAAAESIVVEMLAGFEPDLTDEQILLRLALQALVVDDLPEAMADLEAALELADPDNAAQIELALEALSDGHMEEAQELIEPLSGLPAHEEEEEHGEPAADDDHADEEDDDHD